MGQEQSLGNTLSMTLQGRLPGQCHLYLMDIEWNGYGYWPGSLPGITASRWTFPVVDAVTPKGWTLSWACRARTISGSPPVPPGTLSTLKGTTLHITVRTPACWPHSIYGYRAVCPEHYPFIVTTITARGLSLPMPWLLQSYIHVIRSIRDHS